MILFDPLGRMQALQAEGQGVRTGMEVRGRPRHHLGIAANTGREWEKSEQPRTVNTYDFPDKDQDKACPYIELPIAGFATEASPVPVVDPVGGFRYLSSLININEQT